MFWFSPFVFFRNDLRIGDFDIDLFLESESFRDNKNNKNKKKLLPRRKNKKNGRRKSSKSDTIEVDEKDLSDLIDDEDIDSIIREAERLRVMKMSGGLPSWKRIKSTPYVECFLCRKIMGKANLSAHMKTEHDCFEGGNPFEKKLVSCQMCDKTFGSKSFLHRHVQSVHERIVKAKCDVCDKTFTDTSNYKQHLLIHAGIKSYMCQICGKGFVQPQGLRMHMPSHSSEHPYSCTFCPKKFRRKQHFELHAMKHAGGNNNKSHQCEECGKFFNVKNESRVHNCWTRGKKWRLHPCPHCDKGFNQLSGLRAHLKNHHHA